MLTARRLAGLVAQGEFDRVLDAVEAGGRAMRVRVRQWLRRDEGACAVAAASLALHRVCDLSYGPSPEADSVAARIVGALAPEKIGRLPASALALAASALDRYVELGATDDQEAAPVVFEAIEALGAASSRLASLLEAGIACEEDAELTRWQLLRSPALAREVRARRVAAGGAVMAGLARDIARSGLFASGVSAA